MTNDTELPDLSESDQLTVDKLAFLTGLANTIQAMLDRPDAKDFLAAFFDGQASLHLSRDNLHVEINHDQVRQVDIPTGLYL